MIRLHQYRSVVGRESIDRIQRKARKLRGKHIVLVSSTHQGGGVAEILNTIIFLLNDAGVECGWRIIHGSTDFFTVTKKLHNALQGAHLPLTKTERARYLETNEDFCVFTHLQHHDLVVVHDPQPLPIVKWEKRKRQPWIWRCHIDLTDPDPEAWDLVRPYINAYDHVVVSHETYKQKVRPTQSVITPAIDPLSPKNAPLPTRERHRLLRDHGIDPSRPIIAQVSRFDAWKDPEGVIKVFELVRRRMPCQLVLLGNTASDDPEGIHIYNKIKNAYGKRKDMHILVNVEENDRFVNTIQTDAAVILQKSIREGFGLTVSEALFKGTPVVGSNVGGIPLQIQDRVTGFLHDPEDLKGFADSTLALLKDPKMRRTFGARGRDYVRMHFLITRLLEDWLDLFIRTLR